MSEICCINFRLICFTKFTTKLSGQFGGELGETYESKIYTADFTHDFDTAQLRAILNSHEQNVAWVIDCDYNSNTSCFAGEVNDFENLSLELKLVSTGGGSLNWALGGYWHANIHLEPS